jgi:hypothetical protein
MGGGGGAGGGFGGGGGGGSRGLIGWVGYGKGPVSAYLARHALERSFETSPLPW